MNITKEAFVQTLNDIQICNDKIYSAYQLGIDLIEIGNIVDCLVKLLDSITNKEEWVAYYVYELDYGQKYKEGCVKQEDGSFIDISTAEKLYDFLEADSKE